MHSAFQIDEIRIVFGAGLVTCLQLRNDLAQRMIAAVFNRTHGIPGQCAIQIALTHGLNGLVAIREVDIGQDTTMLRAGPGNAIELGTGQFHLAIIHGNDFLHRAFTEGLAAEHNTTLVILNGTGKNLGRRRTGTIHQYGKRTVVDHFRVSITVGTDKPVALPGVAYLHSRARLNEQTHQLVGFVQGTATVVAQVNHHRFNIILLQLFQQRAHVTGRTAVIGQAGRGRFKIEIKRGQGDHTNPVTVVVYVNFQYFAACKLLRQFNGVAGNGNHPGTDFTGGFRR